MGHDHAHTLERSAAQWFAPTARATRALARVLIERIEAGALTLELPSGERLSRHAATPGPDAVMKLHRWSALRRVVTRGDIGFAEGYMEGDWSTPDLTSLLAFLHANEACLAVAWKGTLLQRLVDRLVHGRRANTRSGSRRNIAAHYDLGNDFYAAWLDPSMSYSSGLFGHDGDSLETAQMAKINRVAELLELRQGDRILEIGCGWGGLAEHLAREHGARMTCLTLSREQLAVAARRLAGADASGASRALLLDYRDCRGQFDRVVSIEMMEATGESYWPQYFATIRDRLAPGGTAVLQVITIAEDRFEDYRERPDFIQRYIFPGGMLPTVTHMRALSAEAGLTLETVELFGASYARTVAQWRERFLRAWPMMTGELRSERFRNMWEYYLAYCEIGFSTGAIDVGLYRLRKAS